MKISLCVALALALCVLLEDVDAQNTNRLGRRQRAGRRRGRGGRRREGRRGGRRPGPIGPGPIGPGPIGPGPIGPGPIGPGPIGPRDCGPIPHLINGYAIESAGDVQYACQPGFKLEGTNIITCIDGRWTVAPRCVRQLCPSPSNVAFATIVETTNGGTTVLYQCQSGYRIQNGGGATTKRINCNRLTQLWEAYPVCEPIQANGCMSTISVNFASTAISGNLATYTCFSGYKLKQGTPGFLRCMNNQWDLSQGLPECIPDGSNSGQGCNNPPPCGGELISRPAVGSSYAFGEKILYTCKTGYRIVGSTDNAVTSKSIECLTNGLWETIPACEPVDCGPVQFGTFNNQNQPSTTTFGTVYAYTCLTNYETTSATSTTCNADGKWSLVSPPNCIPKTCKETSLPTVANAVNQNAGAGAYAMDTNVVFICNSGYRPAPRSGPSDQSIIIKCKADGTFTEPDQTCVYENPKDCAEYYSRDNLTPTATEVQVMIDPDGPNTGSSPFMVFCSAQGTQTCTTIKVNTVNTLNSAETCAAKDLDPVISGVTLGANDNACMDLTIMYGAASTEINSVISHTANCQQKVDISCSAASGFFTTIKTSDQVSGRAYSSQDAGLTGAAAVHTDVCDCFKTNTCGTNKGCACSSPSGTTTSGTDSITKTLNSGSGYITHVGRVVVAGTTVSANTYGVTVGNIICCS